MYLGGHKREVNIEFGYDLASHRTKSCNIYFNPNCAFQNSTLN